jgi:3-dehydroquinate synthase
MIAAALIGYALDKTDSLTAQRVIATVFAYGPLPIFKVQGRRILQRLLADKKTVGGVPHFVLATGMGAVEVVKDVPQRVVLHAIEEMKKLSAARGIS